MRPTEVTTMYWSGTRPGLPWLAAILVCLLPISAFGQWPEPAELVGDFNELVALTPPELSAHRPRLSPDGTQIAFFGNTGDTNDLYLLQLPGGELTRLTETPHDERDPTFTPHGTILYAANPEGRYALFERLEDGSTRTLLEDPEADLLEPTASPILFNFFEIGLFTSTSTVPLETYDKLLYTRHSGGESSIWFVGVGDMVSQTHRGRISPEGQSCDQPVWTGNGLAIAFRCQDEAGSTLYLAEAENPMSPEAALQVLRELEIDGAPNLGCDSYRGNNFGDEEDELDEEPDECLLALPRVYARYPGLEAASSEMGLAAPAFSANQLLLLATPTGGGPIAMRPRTLADWRQWGQETEASPVNPVWAPGGQGVFFESAHSGQSAIYRMETDFYLQEVVDLVDYPELYTSQASVSERMHRNRFVARQGEAKEIHALYNRIAYQRRAVFITADSVLQAFHDEFTRIMRNAERVAARDMHLLSEALFVHYMTRAESTEDARDRFMAAYFAVPYLVLGASQSMSWGFQNSQRERLEELMYCGFDDDCSEYLAAPSAADLYEQHLPQQLEALPEWLQEPVGELLALVLAHNQISAITVPGSGEVLVDFSQFTVRGKYDNPFDAGYFLAVMWYGQLPLPLDASTVEMVNSLATLTVGQPESNQPLTAYDVWQRIDNMVGSFMGQPVQATVDQLRALSDTAPELLEPFNVQAVTAWLQERYPRAQVRGLEGATGDEPPPLRFSLFPRRLGADTLFLSRLTHPNVPERGLPSSLDVWAALGIERARHHALTAEATNNWAETYSTVLAELLGESNDGLLAPTDAYSSWLAMLLSLARSYEESQSLSLPFTAQDAWQDRLLYSTLAGFTQLKHQAVLYAMEEYGIQCGGDWTVYGYVELPQLPPPRGYVEPAPQFFRALHALALTTSQLWQEEDEDSFNLEDVDDFFEAEPNESLTATLERLAQLAERQLAQEPLDDEDYAWMQRIGGILEWIFLQGWPADVWQDPLRQEIGVAITVGIYTNIERGQVLHLGIGRLLDLFVAVPDTVGQRMTQGGLLSFYEFWQPMDSRLTDAAWNERLENQGPPPVPNWAQSFIE